jgi:hypothetical protein
MSLSTGKWELSVCLSPLLKLWLFLVLITEQLEWALFRQFLFASGIQMVLVHM